VPKDHATWNYAYLKGNPKVSVLVDDRSNRAVNFRKAMAVTATGTAKEPKSQETKRLLTDYLKKHPYLREFVTTLSCALLGIRVKTYCIR
jgi:hypothetical protein